LLIREGLSLFDPAYFISAVGISLWVLGNAALATGKRRREWDLIPAPDRVRRRGGCGVF
jgi:hypothetical protein